MDKELEDLLEKIEIRVGTDPIGREIMVTLRKEITQLIEERDYLRAYKPVNHHNLSGMTVGDTGFGKALG